MFGFKKKKVNKIFKIDFITCAYDDGTSIQFKKSFTHFSHVIAKDWTEAMTKFMLEKQAFYAIGNIYVKSIAEVKPIK